jgi:hypothetical protein
MLQGKADTPDFHNRLQKRKSFRSKARWILDQNMTTDPWIPVLPLPFSPVWPFLESQSRHRRQLFHGPGIRRLVYVVKKEKRAKVPLRPYLLLVSLPTEPDTILHVVAPFSAAILPTDTPYCFFHRILSLVLPAATEHERSDYALTRCGAASHKVENNGKHLPPHWKDYIV